MNELLKDSAAVDVGDIAGVSKLSVVFDSHPNNVAKKIYANARMQARITVLISCIDNNGRDVRPPDAMLKSLKLIHYHGGHDLGSQWIVREVPNQYRHDISGAGGRQRRHASDEDENGVVVERWVSCDQLDETRIAAAITLPNGQVVKSNNPHSLIGGSDSSVTLEAIAPVRYGPEYFRLEKVAEPADRGHKIYKWYLGLRVGASNIALQDWITKDIEVFRGQPFYCDSWTGGTINSPLYVVATLTPTENKQLHVWLPTDSADHSGRFRQNYIVDVNDRAGELTIVQGLSGWGDRTRPAKKNPCFITVIDEYGTEHALHIVVNEYEQGFELK